MKIGSVILRMLGAFAGTTTTFVVVPATLAKMFGAPFGHQGVHLTVFFGVVVGCIAGFVVAIVPREEGSK